MVEFIDDHKILLETLIPSDWTWGCELEGFISKSDYHENVNGGYYDEDDDDDIDYNDLCNYFDNIIESYCSDCSTSNSEVHDDGSLHPNYDEYSFEYATPVFKTLPLEYSGFCKFLEEILSKGFFTTSACGFHHHLMYKGMNERDCIWIYCNLAMDENFINFTKNFDDFSLYSSSWARDDAFRGIRKYIKENNFYNVLDYLSTEKYRLFRIHPQGTLEWRGPRDFLNYGIIKIIKKFYFQHLPVIINKFIEYNRSNILYGTNLTKEEFFNKLKEAQKDKPDYYKENLGNNEFIKNDEGTYRNKNKNPNIEKNKNIDKDTINKIWEKLLNKPSIFVKLVKGNNPLLSQLLKMENIKYQYFSKIIESVVPDYLLGLSLKEFSNRIINTFIKNGFALDSIIDPSSYIGSIVTKYLDYNISKEDLISYINNSSGIKLKILYMKLLKDNLINIREAEEILYNNLNDILPNINSGDLLKIKFNSNDIVKFCFFILKLCYQNEIYNKSLFADLRELIILNASDKNTISKWNNMAIGITINENIAFASLIISLKPEEYIRLVTEYPLINSYLDNYVKLSIPEDIKSKLYLNKL